MEKAMTAIERLKGGQQETRDELGAVREGCKSRHEEMTEMVREMGRKAETATQELGKRLNKQEDEMKEGFRMMKEELSETRGEI